jgi:hypothetical protein
MASGFGGIPASPVIIEQSPRGHDFSRAVSNR